MNSSEKWLPVVGYELKYEVSDHGNIRSLARSGEFAARWGMARMRFPAKDMRIAKTKAGYCYASFSKDSTQKKLLIHRVVMATFVGVSHLQVNHKDGVKSNNCVSNLEYCTSSENLLHAARILGTRRGSAMPSKLKEADIPNIREDKRKLREIAEEYGVTLQAIYLVKKRINWGHVK